MTKWRPPEWKNPYTEQYVRDSLQGIGHPENISNYNTYEAGADALLKTLREQGRDMGVVAWQLALTENRNQKGTVVFIPDG